MFVRPEDVRLHADEHGTGSVLSSSFLGAVRRTTVALPDGTTLVSQHASALVPGDHVRVELDPVPVVCAPRS